VTLPRLLFKHTFQAVDFLGAQRDAATLECAEAIGRDISEFSGFPLREIALASENQKIEAGPGHWNLRHHLAEFSGETAEASSKYVL